MKDYYKILEVDKNASGEIIDKAYKTLAKKYHPDLQNSSKTSDEKISQYNKDKIRQKNEEKMKEINEAYEVLSNDFKRKSYDEQLQKSNVSMEEYRKILQENAMLKNELGRRPTQNNSSQANMYNANQRGQNIQNQDTEINGQLYRYYKQQINRAVNKAYQDAYVKDMQNRGYKFKYKPTLKQWITLAIAIIAVILIFVILFQIPPIKDFFITLYNENTVIKVIVDIIKGTFTKGL